MKEYLKEIDPYHLNENVFNLIGKEWMLICAGKKDNYNMMTASWGGLGIMWNKPVAFIFVRPQRYTLDFIEDSDFFTLNFFNKSYHKLLNEMGTKSGREINKMVVDDLSASETNNKAIFFEESRLVLECKKLYKDQIKPEGFIEAAIDSNYKQKDYHFIYFGRVTNAWMKE